MKIDPNIEYSWHQFKSLPEVRILKESEQQRRYYFYLDALANERFRQNKGDTNFILQENGFFLLQENGNRLIWKL